MVACAAAALLLVLPTLAGAASRAPELDQLSEAWSRLTDFQALVNAHEVDGAKTEDRSFHYSFMRGDHAKIEMLNGPDRGTIAIWNGGDRVTAYKRGFLSLVKLSFNVHDKIVTSMRGNTLASPDLGPALHCFGSRLDHVDQLDGPLVDGAPTTMIVLEDSKPLRCPGDSARDLETVTKDVLLISRTTHLPVRRIRYAGDALVEDWSMRDLRVNSGLSQRDFG